MTSWSLKLSLPSSAISDTPHLSPRHWVETFLQGDKDASLFAEDAIWRDYLAMAWNLQSHEGRDTILEVLPSFRGSDLTILDSPSPTEIIFSFIGKHGRIKSLAELRNGLCVRLFTSLEDMNGKMPKGNIAPKIFIFVFIFN